MVEGAGLYRQASRVRFSEIGTGDGKGAGIGRSIYVCRPATTRTRADAPGSTSRDITQADIKGVKGLGGIRLGITGRNGRRRRRNDDVVERTSINNPSLPIPKTTIIVYSNFLATGAGQGNTIDEGLNAIIGWDKSIVSG